MRRLVLASSNTGKLGELRPLLADTGLELVAQSELGVRDAIEDGLTFVENALIKARHACRQTGLPALADDSGIVVDALGGAPGLISAHYAGVHGDGPGNIARVLRELEGVPPERRTARFHCTLVLLRHAEDPQPVIAEGSWEGTILSAPRGADRIVPSQLPSAMTGCGSSAWRSKTSVQWKRAVRRSGGTPSSSRSTRAMFPGPSPCTPA